MEITELLQNLHAGDRRALNEMMPRLRRAEETGVGPLAPRGTISGARNDWPGS